jgi:predicted TIM-barrel fold metal-dependent hydrolase
MALEAATIRRTDTAGLDRLAIVDADVHNGVVHDRLVEYLPQRWRDYIARAGLRWHGVSGAHSTQRPFAMRLDAHPPKVEGRSYGRGGPGGSDPDFSRAQLFEEHGISAAILNCVEPLACGNVPVELEVAYCRAVNDYNFDVWLAHDPRWYASIVVPVEQPLAAAAEVARCAERSDRYVQVFLGSRGERPFGNPKYWPVWEAAAQHDLPIAFHVGTSRYNGQSVSYPGSFYYQHHVGFPLAAQALVSSLVFEGVFDRLPGLEVVLAELAWAWAVPYAWRLDATWRVLRDEVAHLERRPSEYFRDHFWFTTQPAEEPEDPGQIYGLWEQFEQAGFGDKLMFATDYPHWDFDPPSAGVPPLLPRETKQQLLAGNAAALYGIEV